jgi:hypothetical protein
MTRNPLSLGHFIRKRRPFFFLDIYSRLLDPFTDPFADRDWKIYGRKAASLMETSEHRDWEKRFHRGMQGFAADSFIPFQLATRAIRPD